MPAFLSAKQTAEILGYHPSTFRRHMALLVKAGFPELDPVMKKYPEQAVHAWIEKRNQKAMPEGMLGESTREGVNHDAL